MTSIVEIAPDVYRLCTYNPDSGLQFCQFLFKDDEPLLFHTGHRRLFEGVREAVARVIDPATVRWIDDPGHRFTYTLEQTAVTRVKQQGLIVFEQELAELQS